MLFNPDPTKPAQEVIFSRKIENCSHPSIFFNDIHKHPGVYLDEKLNSKKHIGNILCEVSKEIFAIKEIRHTLPKKVHY